MLDWCDRNGVRYIVGLARNAVLEREVAKDGFEATGRKNRLFHEFEYAARSWRRTRRVIARIEHGPKGGNPRFIVTDLPGEANELCERVYCARGDMENRVQGAALNFISGGNIRNEHGEVILDRTHSDRVARSDVFLIGVNLAF